MVVLMTYVDENRLSRGLHGGDKRRWSRSHWQNTQVGTLATDEGIVLDQSRFAESIVLESMNLIKVRNAQAPLDPGY